MQTVVPPPHPVAGVLRVQRIPQRRAALGTGYTPQYFGRVINGWQRPSAEFRRRLAAYLDLPEEELFHLDEVMS